jgi:hypothetical protein
MKMFKFYLDSNFRLTQSPEFPAQFVQYTTADVVLYAPFQNIGLTIIMNVIRPDGFKTNEMFMEYLGEDEENPGIYMYGTTLTPYHTALIPGTQNTGTMIVNFILKQFEDEVVVNILSSPITKIPVERSIEPNAEFLPTSVAENFGARITALEEVSFEHNLLSLQSRSLEDQHPIGAISGLTPKVNVHIGENDPTIPADTWFNVIGIDEEVSIVSDWRVIASTPNISLGVVFGVPPVPQTATTRLVVIGNVDGEPYRQEFYNNPDGSINGAAIILTTELAVGEVEFTLTPIIDGTPGTYPQTDPIVGYQVTQFDNIGNFAISSFTALSLEVFM